MIDKNTIIGREKTGEVITLGNLQALLKMMLKDIVRIFEDNNIYYFVLGGTMIGAIRHSDIIPWDDDVDLGFKLQDYDKVVELLKNNLGNKYEIQCYDTNINFSVIQPIIKVRLKNTYVEYDAWYDRNNCGCNGIFVDLIAFSNCCPTKKDFILRKKALFRASILLLLNYLNINIKSLKKRHLKVAFDYDEKYSDSSFFGYALNFIPWKNRVYDKKDFESLIDVKFDDFTVKVPVGYDHILRTTFGDYMTFPKDSEKKLSHSKNVRLKSDRK